VSRWHNPTTHALKFHFGGQRVEVDPGGEFACSDHLDFAIQTNKDLPLKLVPGSSHVLAQSLAHAIHETLKGKVLELSPTSPHEERSALDSVRSLHHRLSSAAHQVEAGAAEREAVLQGEIDSLRGLYEMQEEELEEMKAKLAAHLAKDAAAAAEAPASMAKPVAKSKAG
jgi:hypothetical protein